MAHPGRASPGPQSSGRIPAAPQQRGARREPRAQRGLPQKRRAPSAPPLGAPTLGIASQGHKKPRGVCLEGLPPSRPLGREKGFLSLFARFSGSTGGVLPRGRIALARPRCRAGLPGGARLAAQPGGFKQKGWSVGSFLFFFFFLFREQLQPPFARILFFLPPAGPPDHCVLPLLPLASDWHASRTEEFPPPTPPFLLLFI